MKQLFPVLILGYNRPKLLEKQIKSIVNTGRYKIYVSIDGAVENDLVRTCHSVVEKFKGSVHTIRFSNSSSGCKLGVESALDWFFSLENIGLILEDDVHLLYDISDSLEGFIEHSDFVHLGLNNFEFNSMRHELFLRTKSAQVWGWVTTRSNWQDYRLNGFSKYRIFKNCIITFKLIGILVFLNIVFNLRKVSKGFDTWDYGWQAYCMASDKPVLIFREQLIRNLGFGGDATHTAENKIVKHRDNINEHMALNMGWFNKKFYR